MRISLTPAFERIPEGEYTFHISHVDYNEEFGKLSLKLVTEKGLVQYERYNLMTKDGEPNNGALMAFSILARAAMNDNDAEDIDPMELLGRYIRCEVYNQENGDKTYTHIRNIVYSEGFGNTTPAPVTTASAPAAKFDLDSFFK